MAVRMVCRLHTIAFWFGVRVYRIQGLAFWHTHTHTLATQSDAPASRSSCDHWRRRNSRRFEHFELTASVLAKVFITSGNCLFDPSGAGYLLVRLILTYFDSCAASRTKMAVLYCSLGLLLLETVSSLLDLNLYVNISDIPEKAKVKYKCITVAFL